jgi:hypothetical protein
VTAVDWLALALFLVALVAAPWYAIRHGWHTYKAMTASLERLTDALGEALAKLDEAPQHMDDAAAAAERLNVALARLSRSRSRLKILLDALTEAQTSLGGMLAFVPRSK